MWQQQILGTPEELPRVVAQLEVHGVTVERIAVMQPFEKLSPPAAKALLAIEQSSDVKVDWIVERLGLLGTPNERDEATPDAAPLAAHHLSLEQPLTGQTQPLFGNFGYVKRGFDILSSLLLIGIFTPLLLVIALLAIWDVGLPLIFWQQRPGRFGRPFKLYKFCTMRPSHDEESNRVPDELRLSRIGRLLRRGRLDELPQLYNILIGEMSLVGPRPLLPVDQPEEMGVRLVVRPGLTGLAQVNGGRHLSAEDKNALDIWYIRNASLWLDIKILLRTLVVLIWGERDDPELRAPWVSPERLTAPSAAYPGSHLSEPKIMGGQIEGVPSAS
jgi:lipopolysaccharide/colanic/teichoic acid biosynthesis glycosyltransferase